MNLSIFPDAPRMKPSEANSVADIDSRFAQYLRLIRKEAGMTQLDLSLALCRGPKYIWRVEQGRSLVTLRDFIQILDALQIDPVQGIGEVLRMHYVPGK